ncbi:glycosyltransferase [Tuanshanicoccus yangjingiae]|uniref:glycosyltransferase n=1 Tax=Aerococcaceae bacterium zg-252 TaxID=2796928 RepID=UPI0040637AFE
MDIVNRINNIIAQWYERLFFIPFIVFVTLNLLLISNLPLPAWIAPLSKVPMLLLVIKIVWDIYAKNISKTKLIVSVFVLLVSMLVVLLGGQKFVLYYSLLTIGAHGIELRKILKVWFYQLAPIVFIIFVFSLLGIIENEVHYRENGITIRYAFGIGYPTDFSGLIFYIYGIFSYLLPIKQWKKIVLGVSLAALVFFFVDARLDTILILVLLGAMVVVKPKHFNGKIANLLPFLPLIYLIVSLLMAYCYNSEIQLYAILDKVLSGRLQLGHNSLMTYPIKAFGQIVEMNGYGNFNPNLPYSFIDNAYIQMVLRFGWVYSLTMVIFQGSLIYRAIIARDVKLALLLLIFGLHGMVAHHFFNPIYNPFWIGVLCKDRRQEQELSEIMIVSQVKDKGNGLGKAVNDVISFLRAKANVEVSVLDITDNKYYLLNLIRVFFSNASVIYFTPAGSLWGNVRDSGYLFIALISGKKIVTHFHNSNFGNVVVSKRWLLWLNRFIYQRVSRIILLGEKQKEMFELLYIDDNKFNNIPNPINDELFISEEEFDLKKGNKVVYFSNMIKDKGYLEVLDLAKYMKDDPFAFYFCGKFYDDEAKQQFMQQIRELKNVHYIGGVYNVEKIRFLKTVDYFILPTQYKDETLPISMLEAMANGAFILINNRGVISEYVNHKTTRFIDNVPSSDIRKLIIENYRKYEYRDFEIDKMKKAHDFYTIHQLIENNILELIWGQE